MLEPRIADEGCCKQRSQDGVVAVLVLASCGSWA